MLAGTFVGVGATSASAAPHWSGNYSTKADCERMRDQYADYGHGSSPCYKTYNQNGSASYHFWWYD